jgi:hypothetical protein
MTSDGRGGGDRPRAAERLIPNGSESDVGQVTKLVTKGSESTGGRIGSPDVFAFLIRFLPLCSGEILTFPICSF